MIVVYNVCNKLVVLCVEPGNDKAVVGHCVFIILDTSDKLSVNIFQVNLYWFYVTFQPLSMDFIR